MEIINLILIKHSLNKISKDTEKKLIKYQKVINNKTNKNIKLSINNSNIEIKDKNKIIYHKNQYGYIFYNGTAITNLEDSKFAATNNQKRQIIRYLPEDSIFQILCSQELNQSLEVYNNAMKQYDEILEKKYNGKTGKELVKKLPSSNLKPSVLSIK